jgi:hypothetical protein
MALRLDLCSETAQVVEGPRNFQHRSAFRFAKAITTSRLLASLVSLQSERNPFLDSENTERDSLHSPSFARAYIIFNSGLNVYFREIRVHNYDAKALLR